MSAYHLIQAHYGDRRAERSGVPLIKHIEEGLRILDQLGANSTTKEAWCLHPMLQSDADLRATVFARGLGGLQRIAFDSGAMAILLAMEYRSVANAWLSDKVWYEQSCGPQFDNPPELSCLGAVNEMLIADKVQNRQDFELYHKATHPRSAELNLYFDVWLKVLGIDEAKYRRLARLAKGGAA